MAQVWKPKGGVRISALQQKGFFLAEFASLSDLLLVREDAPWQYRTDYVALRQVTGPDDILRCEMQYVEVWAQAHVARLELLSMEGARMVMEKIGTLLSEVSIMGGGGRRFLRAKMRIDIKGKLIDAFDVLLPSLGELKVYIVYEKLSRYCPYCKKIGHDITTCKVWSRILSLKHDPRFATNQELLGLSPIQIKPWIADSTQVPLYQSGQLRQSGSMVGDQASATAQNLSHTNHLIIPRPNLTLQNHDAQLQLTPIQGTAFSTISTKMNSNPSISTGPCLPTNAINQSNLTQPLILGDLNPPLQSSTTALFAPNSYTQQMRSDSVLSVTPKQVVDATNPATLFGSSSNKRAREAGPMPPLADL